MVKAVLAGAAVMLVLAGCSEGRSVYGCMPDGSPVFYQYPNTSGNYDGAQARPENCNPS